MSRGFLAGAGWGTVVAVLGLVIASQVTEIAPGKLEKLPPAVEVANAPSVTDPVVAPAAEPEPPAMPDASAPVAEIAKVPETEVKPTTVDENAVVAATPEPAPATSEPVLAIPEKPQDAMPGLANSDAGLTATPVLPTASASPTLEMAPDSMTASDGQGRAPDPQSEVAGLPKAQMTVSVPDAADSADQLPEAPSLTDAPAVGTDSVTAKLPDSDLADLAPEDADLPPTAPVTTAIETLTPVTEPVATPKPAPVEGLAPTPAETATVVTAPEATMPAADSSAPVVARPAPGFDGKVDGVKIGRLPSIGGEEAPPESAEEPTSEAVVPVAEDSALPAIDRFARAFENTAKKPLFGILLQDTGAADLDRVALAKLPFPVSFVIDPAQPDAASAAKIYRDAGQEVLMLVSGIPAGASASDLGVSFEAMFSVLPEAVGIVDLQEGGFQGNRSLATQVLALVQDQGRGVISWDRGLNAASQVARREGIRNATIFRSLDGEGETTQTIRRYLDRAAFKAAQDGRVMVAGQTRPETVAALLEWAVEGRAATVAIAPSTAVMTSQ
ncbi:MAG: divergent polysaccharide deacetylase family protein [Pseudorhodobacter sp.]